MVTPKKPKIWSGKLDGYLKKNLDACKEVMTKDWDMVFIVDGYEGSGKSVLAQQMAKYVDPTFNIDRICFNPTDFIQQINKASKYEAIVYDEAMEGLSSRAAMSLVNRSLVAVLSEIRQKNLWVFIILPCFFELDKYPAIWRSRALIHVYLGDKFERGKFAFFNQERKKQLYVLGKKFYSYHKPASNFYGSFSNGYAVDEKDYRAKKSGALKAREDSENRHTPTQLKKFKEKDELIGKLFEDMKKKTGATDPELGQEYGFSYKTIEKYRLKYRASIHKEDKDSKPLPKPLKEGGAPVSSPMSEQLSGKLVGGDKIEPIGAELNNRG